MRSIPEKSRRGEVVKKRRWKRWVYETTDRLQFYATAAGKGGIGFEDLSTRDGQNKRLRRRDANAGREHKKRRRRERNTRYHPSSLQRISISLLSLWRLDGNAESLFALGCDETVRPTKHLFSIYPHLLYFYISCIYISAIYLLYPMMLLSDPWPKRGAATCGLECLS